MVTAELTPMLPSTFMGFLDPHTDAALPVEAARPLSAIAGTIDFSVAC